MLVTGNIKKIMYMGKEISEIRCNNETVWLKETPLKPPPPKPCSTTHQCHQCGACERSNQCHQCGACERSNQCTCQSSGQSCGQGCTACLKNQSTETA